MTWHYKFIENKPDVPWLEVHTENIFSKDSTSSKYLAKIRQDYPISAHCVGLSLGSANVDCPVREQHLQNIKRTLDWLQPSMVSDHLSWSASDGVHYLPDLLPIPYTEEAFNVVTANINRVQDVLQRQFLIENPSSYLTFVDSTMLEWDFLGQLSKETGCGLLLDVNNIYVSAHNHGFDASMYLNKLPCNALDTENEFIDIDKSISTFLILFRKGLKTVVMSVSEGEYALIEAFNHEIIFEQAINLSIAKQSDLSIDHCLQKFIELGIISGFFSALTSDIQSKN